MRCLLSVWGVEGEPAPAPEVLDKMYKEVDVFNQKLMKAGSWVFGGSLHPVETATTVRPKGHDTVVTDGPFAEAKEHLGGFWIIKAPDLDAALAIAKEGAVACQGPVEVRPFEDEPEA